MVEPIALVADYVTPCGEYDEAVPELDLIRTASSNALVGWVPRNCYSAQEAVTYQ